MVPLEIEFEHISKTFSPGSYALSAVNLRIEPGERLAVLGPSGSGKTTLLRLIAGLESPEQGTIRIGGRDVVETPPHRRQVAMVFQYPALYPHLSVRDNLVFGPRSRGVPRSRRLERAAELASMLELTALLDRRPQSLSGGERQRTALGRAVAVDPAILLLDEPFSSLDAPLRDDLRGRVIELHRRLGCTLVHVTHDQAEAMAIGKRVAVLRQGQLMQFGTPREVHDRPADSFVASFVGNPGMNLLECELARELDSLRIRLCTPAMDFRVDLGEAHAPTYPPVHSPSGVLLGFRPEHVRVRTEECPTDRLAAVLALPAEVVGMEFQGHSELVSLKLAACQLRARVGQDVSLSPGQRVWAEVDLTRAIWFDRATGRRLDADCQSEPKAIA